MEKRLSRFIRNRRSRLSEASLDATNATPQFMQGQLSPSTKRPSIFPYQTSIPETSDLAPPLGPGDISLRSFSYDSCPAGKPPTFIGKAQPGNGPVKLQASRRLSTGELIVSTEEGALDDIRGGDYIVGRKDRCTSTTQRPNSSLSRQQQPPPSTPYAQSPLASPQLETPSPSRTWSNTPNTPCCERSSSTYRPSEALGDADPPPQDTRTSRTSSSFIDQTRTSKYPPIDFRLLDSRYSTSHDSLTSQRTSTPESNATLFALKKAEYSRLTNLYGPEAAAVNLARLYSSPLSPVGHGISPLLESVQLPPAQSPRPDSKQEQKKTSRFSGGSDNLFEESSGTSSPQRTSFVSSQAGSSSTTARTTLTDEDSMTSREDIRSMVEQIRSTYLDAFDAHTSPPRRKKSVKKRKKQKPKMTLSPIARTFEQDRHKVPSGRQTWHPQTPDQSEFSRPRVNSHPVSTVGRLSPIPASPPRDDSIEVGIKRADSTTLGALMADMTRAHKESQISNRASEPVKRNFSRPSTPRRQISKAKDSWLDLGPDLSEDVLNDSSHDTSQLEPYPCLSPPKIAGAVHVHTITPESRDSFEALYQDLFGTDADDLWRTSSVTSSNSAPLRLTHSNDNNHNSRLSTPRKQLHIASIPESPEYTHLADPDCPHGRPI